MIKITKGLDLPIEGEPAQSIAYEPKIHQVALIGPDYVGMKPTILVKEGDAVQLGQVLFTDKKTEGVAYTSPGTGTVKAIHRGDKRSFQSIVIDLDPKAGDADQVTFPSHKADKLSSLDQAAIRKQLVDSGLWTALRTRPFSRTPAVDSEPHSIFVTAINSDPLGLDPKVVISAHLDDFASGLTILSKLTKTKVHLCQAPGQDFISRPVDNIKVTEFTGKHPAGLPGTHIHHLDPVSENKTVWHIGYQDVIAIGKLFTTGKLWMERIVALGGPAIKKPALAKVRVGARVSDIVVGQLEDGEIRTVSGSVIHGRKACGQHDFLGRFHTQVSALEEGRHREFLGWKMPGFNKFSVKRSYIGGWLAGKKFGLTTNTNGGHRAMVPIGCFEKVMPLDIIPTFLLRSLISNDVESSVNLGALELDEEDLALCTFVSPGKTDFGPILRTMLTNIQKEG